MEWLTENWFFVLLLVAFLGLHLFGHGHGGHGGHGSHDPHDDHQKHRA